MLPIPSANAAEVATPGVLALESVDEEAYTESFVALIDGDEGTYFKVQLGVSNVGPGDGKGACRVLMAKEGTAPWNSDVVVDSDWAYANGTLRVGKCRASAGRDLRIEGEIGGRTFALKLAEAPRRTRVMRVQVADRFYESDVLIPWARAELTVNQTSGGAAPLKIRGMGYADHSRSTTYPTDTAQRWIRFRALKTDPDDRKILLVRETKGGAVDGWVWTQASRTPVTRMRVAVRGPKRKPQVRALIDGEGGPWRVTSKTLLFRHAPLEDRGLLGAVVGVAVGNPVTYTYRATLAKKGGGSMSGLLEMAISDE